MFQLLGGIDELKMELGGAESDVILADLPNEQLSRSAQKCLRCCFFQEKTQREEAKILRVFLQK